ncbi:unnamed protein product [Rotaria sordida]|uniref:G-protein coupled receptors family 1 profile domain-containing protein n=2 Tax=Rotaria sordida TaxID=392033 RepID=A0A814JFJ3_9BILA|nr:unnamed protein product [Rotaria sordida]CAF4029095.1 unnamed protein product [Rotaria sordida]
MIDTTNDTNFLHAPSPASCEELENLLKFVNASYYESRNMTRDDYFTLLRTPYCIPKPYLGVQGVKKWIITIILVCFLICGLIGNILSATIMFRRSRRGLSSYFYLALLAIMDICVLYTGCLLFMFDIGFGYHPESNSTINCRLGSYIRHLVTYLSAWLIVAVTFERFIVVRFPLQSVHICRMHVAYGITLIIFIFFSFYTTHCFFTMNIKRISLQTDDGYHPNFFVCDLEKFNRLLAFIDLCFYSVIPSILIIIFNTLIISTMFYAIRQRRTYLQASSCLPTTDTSQRNHNQKTKSSSSIRAPFFRSRSVESSPAARSFISHGRVYHNGLNKNNFQQKSQQVLYDSTSATGIRLTCSLLIISFVFVLCTLPVSMRQLIADLFPEYKSTTHWQITGVSLTVLMYLNHTVNFVLYCLTGRAFRRECRKLLSELWRLKDIRISCIINSNADKHHHYHQQMSHSNRNRIIILEKGPQQRMKRSCLQKKHEF